MSSVEIISKLLMMTSLFAEKQMLNSENFMRKLLSVEVGRV